MEAVLETEDDLLVMVGNASGITINVSDPKDERFKMSLSLKPGDVYSLIDMLQSVLDHSGWLYIH